MGFCRKPGRDRSILAPIVCVCLALVLCWHGEAFGLQGHATPEEGQYSHQIGHLFFILSMVIFAFWLGRTRLVEKKGWRFLQYSCLLFILWNLNAVAGHEVELLLDRSSFTGAPTSRFVANPKEIIPYLYFFLKMDHFLCVPAMIFLLLGLKKLNTELEENRP